MIKSNESHSRKYCIDIWGDNPNDPFVKRPYKKGQHGRNSMSKNTPDAKARKHAQILKTHYLLSESDFRKIISTAKRQKGNIIDNISTILESMPFVIAYRAKLAPTMFAARQMVSHRNILLNGKKCMRKQVVKISDTLSISSNIASNDHINMSLANLSRPIPDYITVDVEKKTASINRNISFKELFISKIIDVNTIVSRYARMI